MLAQSIEYFAELYTNHAAIWLHPKIYIIKIIK